MAARMTQKTVSGCMSATILPRMAAMMSAGRLIRSKAVAMAQAVNGNTSSFELLAISPSFLVLIGFVLFFANCHRAPGCYRTIRIDDAV